MKWELVPFEDLIPGEKYMIIHNATFHFITSWKRKYYGRFKHRNEMAFFTISYCIDYSINDTIFLEEAGFLPCVDIYKMIRTGQSNMERRSYEMVLQQLVDGMIVPSFL